MDEDAQSVARSGVRRGRRHLTYTWLTVRPMGRSCSTRMGRSATRQSRATGGIAASPSGERRDCGRQHWYRLVAIAVNDAPVAGDGSVGRGHVRQRPSRCHRRGRRPDLPWLTVRPWVARVQPGRVVQLLASVELQRVDSFTFKANDGTVDATLVPSRSPSPDERRSVAGDGSVERPRTRPPA